MLGSSLELDVLDSGKRAQGTVRNPWVGAVVCRMGGPRRDELPVPGQTLGCSVAPYELGFRAAFS